MIEQPANSHPQHLKQYPELVTSWIVFLFPALALTTNVGVGLIEAASLLTALIYMKPLYLLRAECFRPARWIVLAFALNFIVAVASASWAGFALSSIDKPVRQLLMMVTIGLIVLAKPRAAWLWYGLFCGTAGAAAIALYQRIGLHMDRANGAHNAIMFGDIAIAMGMMSLMNIQKLAGTRLALLPYAAGIAGLTASILSGSRGGWLVLAFIPLYTYGRHMVSRRIIAVTAVGMSLLAAAYFMPQSKVATRIAEVVTDVRQYNSGDPKTSVGLRLEMWHGAWKIFTEHPLIGIGRNNFNAGLNELIARNEINPAAHEFDHAHNEILNALATEGVIGAAALLFLYIAPLVFFLACLRRRDDTQSYALAGLTLVLSFISFGLTQVMFAHHIGTAFYALGVSILAGICIKTQPART